ncbi:hypothetical protein GGI04_001846 [Coemansia thaxteri]|uniref:Uncharacterized protein n=1 Tax=Coemansia thaxteri TaxID=2663907 RepID=A0A9W8BPE4_9FUNG|nr:hypothetical protein GGI04_001846 [Coemansia thaxteri]KAJ2008590.1 hypothetical protein H4R26_000063 [Coemansia thaxteri]KAJ2472276.1 hypothetical protein GGI02_001691 [Coemansia sp. RSA 2322]KAJ2488161.1 hypothetical protein EV174_000129 [Coemansia sp. RSA 2320]
MARPGGPFGGGHGQQHQQQSYGRPQVGGYPPYGGRPHGGYNSNHNGGGGGGSGDMVTKVLGKIMGSLFGAKGGGGPMMGTRDISGSGGATTTHDDWDGFDSSDAVQKTVAEHYYRHIYRKRMDMRQATAQTLGGAAAIKVLRHESKMEQDIYGSGMPLPTDLQHDQVMMGLVLSEVGDLLELKAQAAPLHRDETLENVGRIAIATLVKIKIDESRAIDNVPTHRDSSSHDYYDRPPPPRKHASTRHRHRRQESGEESNYATREKDNHHYSH